MWELAVCDLDGRARDFLTDFLSLAVTPRINGYAELELELDTLGRGAGEVAVGNRSIKAYQDDQLRFFGKVWEPLGRTSATVKVTARDPYAEVAQRRVQAPKDYTATNNAGGPWDAGQIAFDRLAIQNLRRSTYLRAGTRQASANRIRSYLPGTLEGDILDELAGAADGLFYRVAPVDEVAGVMGDLLILYPDAGTTRETVRFEYGASTRDDMLDYEVVDMLPRNRWTVASSANAGGRIAKTAEDAASIATHGLFEDETTYSDVDELATLEQAAIARVDTGPPRTLKLMPGLDSPLLFVNFDVGDFVRVRIDHGGIDLFEWARVLEATLAVDADGIETLAALTVELVVGGTPAIPPHLLYRVRIDDERRRLEALERKVETMTANVVTPPADPAPGGGDPDPVPPDDPDPGEPGGDPPPPPPAPTDPPTVSGVGTEGATTTSLIVGADIDGRGLDTTVVARARRQSDGVVVRTAGPVGVGTGGHVSLNLAGLQTVTAYTLEVDATNAAGTGSGSTSASTPAVGFE